MLGTRFKTPKTGREEEFKNELRRGKKDTIMTGRGVG